MSSQLSAKRQLGHVDGWPVKSMERSSGWKLGC